MTPLAAGLRALEEPLKQIAINAGLEGGVAALFLTTEAVVAEKPEKAAAPAAPDPGGMDF